MLTWTKASSLPANDFIKLMRQELSNNGLESSYPAIAKLIYRSHSRMQTWCAPNSKEPLPMNERHHIWLVVRYAIESRAPRALLQKWTEEETAYLISHYKSHTSKDIAAHLGRPISSVNNRLVKLDLRRQEYVRFTKEDLALVRDLTLTAKQVALKTGKSISSIRNKRCKLKLKKGKTQ